MNTNTTNWTHIATMDAPAITAALSSIITAASKTLPYVGKLRHRSKLVATEKEGAPLKAAREAADKAGCSLSSVDNAAPFERVFCILVLGEKRKNGSPMLSEDQYDALTYRQAVTLNTALTMAHNSPTVREAIHKYLNVTKFRDDWTGEVLSRAEKAAAPSTPETPTPQGEGSTPAPVTPQAGTPSTESTASTETPSNVVSLPAPAKIKNAKDATDRILDAIRALCADLNDNQLSIVRANLARAVNSPETFKAALAPVETAKAA